MGRFGAEVYIVGHIPPGSDERHIGLQQNGHTTFTESNNKRYLELVRKYSSIIQGQFFGHLHSDSFRIIYDDKGKPVSWMMISPSVTPRKMSVGSNNPAMRLYKFDTDSGQVLDYTQYYMDLQAANTMGEPNWVSEYNLTHYYALSDISAISLHNFVDRFTSNDGSWFAKYYRANTVRYQNDPCEGVCMLNHYCAITRVDYKEFRQCLEKEQSALRSTASHLQHLNAKCILLLAILSSLTMAYLQGICDALHTIVRMIIRCQQECQLQLNASKISYGINIKLIEIPKGPMKAFPKQIQATAGETKPGYSVMPHNNDGTNERNFKLPGRLGQHSCGYCLQQRPMRATNGPKVPRSQHVNRNYNHSNIVNSNTEQGLMQHFSVTQMNGKQTKVVIIKKALAIMHNNTNDLRLEYLKLSTRSVKNFLEIIAVYYTQHRLRLEQYVHMLNRKIGQFNLFVVHFGQSKLPLGWRLRNHLQTYFIHF